MIMSFHQANIIAVKKKENNVKLNNKIPKNSNNPNFVSWMNNEVNTRHEEIKEINKNKKIKNDESDFCDCDDDEGIKILKNDNFN